MTGKELIKQILDKNLTNSEVVVFNAPEDARMVFVGVETEIGEGMDDSEVTETVCALIVE